MEMFSDINLTNKALDGALLKKNAISQNISNVDTPNYKRKDVDFETLLDAELKRHAGNTNTLDLETLNPTVYTDHSTFAYRMDGNNVDIDTEMSEEAKISLKYNALVTRVNAQLGRFKTVLQNL